MTKTYMRVDLSELDRYERLVGRRMDDLREDVENIVRHIRDSWSPFSPSAPGDPPAVVTGELDASIRLIRRDTAGRFATATDARYWTVSVGAVYSAAQEFGRPAINLAPRPYLRPAWTWASSTFPVAVKEVFKFR